MKELARMLDLFGKHPNYPQWNGRPVVNLYPYLSWTPEELADQVREVTGERVRRAMETVRLDTVYFLRGEEAQ